MRAASPRRPSRSRPALAVLAALLLGACATAAPRPQPLPADAAAARDALEQRWRAFTDLRTLANLQIKRSDRTERLTGALLLRTPSALRFEALSPFGPPILIVGASPDGVTVWEVVKSRAYLLPASPDANRRWLGLALGVEDLVSLLSGHVVPMKEPLAGEMLPADDNGASLLLRGAAGSSQRIWLDRESGRARRVEWTGGKQPLIVAFAGGSATEPITGLTLQNPGGRLEVRAQYQRPQVDSRFPDDLLRVNVPQGVEIQDFR